MGHRTNLILVENGAYRLFYDHWCANTMDADLFWGPDYAREFILAHKECEINDENWLDEKWADGGVLLDMDKKCILFFLMEDLKFDLQLRHVYMDLFRKIWKGWNVQYAQRGIAQLADYVGRPLDNIITPRTHPEPYPVEKIFSHSPTDPGELFVSIKRYDGTLDIYISSNGIVEISDILENPQFISRVSQCDRHSELLADSPVFSNQYSQLLGGIHIDELAKTIHYWTFLERFRCLETIRHNWPGWTIHRLGDNYLEHTRLTDGKIQFPEKPRESLIREIGHSLFRTHNASHTTDLIQTLQKSHKDVEVNPAVFIEAHWQMNPDTRLQIWKSVIDQESPPINLASTLPSPQPESPPTPSAPAPQKPSLLQKISNLFKRN